MRRVLVIAIVAVVARAGAQAPSVPTVLTSIDSVPTQAQLDGAFGSGSAMNGLTAIALDASGKVGNRLRAIHALVQYCTPPCADGDAAHAALLQLVQVSPVPQSGPDLLVLRAAIESLGMMRDPNDYGALRSFLDHNSRDIRATTARALGDLCNTNAIADLRARTQFETIDQVKLAISSALRALSACPP
ncbi:MAG: HEAT repeat domain-containing protein [Acidobacteriota bacterium]